MENEVYLYKKEDLTTKYFYHNKWLMSFISNLGYLGGGVPSDEADRKCLQYLIDV